MALIIVPVTSGSPFTGFSTPYQVSFVVEDSDGSGGLVLLNAVGVNKTVGSNYYVDMKTLFGTAFRSTLLAALFRRPIALNDDNNACNLFVPNLGIEIEQLGTGSGVEGNPRLNYRATAGGENGPFLAFQFPEIASDWRLSVRLRPTAER